MSSPRLPSPLRRLAWNGESWVAPDRAGETADDELWPRWLGWAESQHLQPHQTSAATAAVRLLRTGASIPAASAAAMIAGLRGTYQHVQLLQNEERWIQSVVDDLGRMEAPPDLTERYGRRLAAVRSVIESYSRPPVGAAESQLRFRTQLTAAFAQQGVGAAPAAGEATKRPQPPAAPFSLRDLFAENSVLVLAALGAFLLVVATVLFELYGTSGLGGGVRLGAVVFLTIVFAVAGYLARRRKGLEAVGQIYIALAAVLLPLVGVAAWTFLDLGAHGIAVHQAVAITAAACAAVYGGLALRLDLRAYGEITGVALLVTLVAVSRWAGGDYWLAAGVAIGPLVFAVWQRALPARVFSHFQWFAHASAVLAAVASVRYEPAGWLWTVTLTVLAVSYLGWQALSPAPIRAWIGEGAAILAGAAAAVAIGVGAGRFVIPMLVAIPLVALSREPGLFGIAGRLYRPHVAHLHVAVALGLALAGWEYGLGGGRSLAAGLAIACGLYAADYYLGGTEVTGYALRATLPLALAAIGRAAGLGPWTGALTAFSLVGFALPFARASLAPLRRHATPFFYGALVVVIANLEGAVIGPGRWEIVAALAVSALAFGAAAELGAVRFSAIAARLLLSLGWFGGVDALNAGGWRGPFDALLALLYVIAGQARALARHTVASARRRWFVHGTATVALGLCFTGPEDQLWWRLAAAFGALAVAYSWLAAARDEIELPWLAWATVAAGAASLVIAAVPGGWQGSAIAAEALVLTGAWLAIRLVLHRPRLETGALAVLGLLAALGVLLTLRDQVPAWSQAAALVLAGVFLFAWSVAGAEDPLPRLRPYERSAASFLAATGALVGCAVLRLDQGVVGLLIIAIAAAHGEWTARAGNQVERWYAPAAMLAAIPVLYLWPYAQQPAALVAVELIGVAAITVRIAVRTGRSYLVYPAVLALAPALDRGFAAAGVSDRVAEEIAFAVLAWAVGFAAIALRTRYARRWAWAAESGAATIALAVLVVAANRDDADLGGIALLAYASLIYTVAMQDRQRWVLPFAPGAAFLGAVVLLEARNADTILYVAALGLVGLVTWALGRLMLVRLGRHPVVDMHRYLGAGSLVVAAAAGFFFPDRTGRLTLGAGLATLALLVTALVLWLDSVSFAFRPNRYVAIVAGCTAFFFVARFAGLTSWELLGPGTGLIAVGIALRHDPALAVDVWIRRLLVASGLALAMGWAATLTVEGEVWWLVTLLVQGSVTVAAGLALRSRTLLAGGGVALVLASLRAMLLIAAAGYLFAAFAVVALALLALATALALGRERYLSGTSRLREQLSHWD